jgi:hypothetical protein
MRLSAAGLRSGEAVQSRQKRNDKRLGNKLPEGKAGDLLWWHRRKCCGELCESGEARVASVEEAKARIREQEDEDRRLEWTEVDYGLRVCKSDPDGSLHWSEWRGRLPHGYGKENIMFHISVEDDV